MGAGVTHPIIGSMPAAVSPHQHSLLKQNMSQQSSYCRCSACYRPSNERPLLPPPVLLQPLLLQPFCNYGKAFLKQLYNVAARLGISPLHRQTLHPMASLLLGQLAT